MEFIRAFCSWEPTQWTNMKLFLGRKLSKMKFMKIYSKREHRKVSRVWFMWIWIKLLERRRRWRFWGAVRVVKVSQSFNLCTFCLRSLVIFDYILFALFPSLAIFLIRPFHLKGFFFGKCFYFMPERGKWNFIHDRLFVHDIYFSSRWAVFYIIRLIKWRA